MRHPALPKLVLLALLLPLPAFAASLDEGLRLYDELQYEAAVPPLEDAARDEGLPASDRAKAALTLGIIHMALGRDDQAGEAFLQALRLDRSLESPPDASPKIRRAIDAAREQVVAETPPTPPPVELVPPPGLEAPEEALVSEDGSARHLPPAPGPGRAQVVVTLDPARLTQIVEMVVRYRVRGESFWLDTSAEATDGAFTATLPGPGDADGVEYYIELFGPDRQLATTFGSAQEPLVARKNRPAPGSALAGGEPAAPAESSGTQWWLWAGLGAVVVGGIVAALIVTSGGGCDAPDGSGCIEVSLP